MKKQKGSVLIITLFLLLGLTIIAAATFNTVLLNTRIINNEVIREELRYKIYQAYELMVHDLDNYKVAKQTITVDGVDVVFTKQCVFTMIAQGDGQAFQEIGGDLDNPQGIGKVDSVWVFRAYAKDKGMTQGIIGGMKVRMLAGDC